MWHDVWLALGLRRRQLADTARYWLRTLGCEPGSRSRADRAYAVYLALLGAWWIVAMLALALQSAIQLGLMLPAEVNGLLLAALPWTVLAAQALAAAAALRSNPLKLTFPDIAYLAGTPLRRGALALVAWGLAVARILAVALLVAALVALALAQGAAPAAPGQAAASAVAVALPLVALTVALAWCLALVGRGTPSRRAYRLAWLALPALAAATYLLPAAFLWPGRALALAVAGQAERSWAPALWLALVPVAALLAWLGGRTHMAVVARQSQTYARIQALGMGAQLQPDVVQGIRRQARLAGRQPFLRLPGVGGAWALVARTAVTLARDPGALLSLALWGGLIAEAAAWLAQASAYPPQWAAWLFMATFAPPAALAATLGADAGDPFRRQLLPQGNLRLLAADTALPTLAVAAVALASWLLRRPTPGAALLGVLTIAAFTGLMVLCQGVASLPVRVLGRRVSYPLAAMASLGAVVIVAMEAQAPLATLGVAVAVAVALVALVRRSPRIAAV